MSRPVLLDLFCGAGGCAVGYNRAGFDVVGVDHKPQPRYPFAFIECDALGFLKGLLAGEDVAVGHGLRLEDFQAIHASPPCQRYSMGSRNIGRAHLYPDLVGPVRELLEKCGRPWVIENVQGSPLLDAAVLCGSMFGLGVAGMWLRRHRLFESNWLLVAPSCAHPKGRVSIGVYGNGTPSWHREKLGRNVLAHEWREAMGIDWMANRKELAQAIPPAFTEYVGRQLMQVVTAEVA